MKQQIKNKKNDTSSEDENKQPKDSPLKEIKVNAEETPKVYKETEEVKKEIVSSGIIENKNVLYSKTE